ncbi:MAG: hypothetical protein M0Z53_00845 [Thermaerobacter sp.]|nr:hypothetical protein [Thermaerobacter sp.]
MGSNQSRDAQSIRELIRQELAHIHQDGEGQGETGTAGQNPSLRNIVREEVQHLQNARPGSTGGHRRSKRQSAAQIKPASGENASAAQTGPSGGAAAGASAPNRQAASPPTGAPNGKSSQTARVATRSQAARSTSAPAGNKPSAQTAAQALTEAQYELSRELRGNLSKLRSVIQQSQEIAKKIEMVLGQGEQGGGTA